MVKIDGRESLLRSVELFLNRENIKQVQLVVSPEGIEEARRKYGPHLGFAGVKLVSGGPKWMQQIGAAAERLAPEATHVILHDAARPAVPYSDLDAILEAAEKHPAVALVSPIRSALVEVDEGGNALATHSASQFMQLLTPQAYSREKFLAMAAAQKELHASELTLLKGSALNVRVGGGADGGLAKAMIAMLPKAKIRPPSSPFEEAQW
jgi:2-C-methyl-D-erythritol 4-phosphate cytidylyltransferase